jgi:hypothetical protein
MQTNATDYSLTAEEYEALDVEERAALIESDSYEAAARSFDTLAHALDDLDKFAPGHGDACAVSMLRELARGLVSERPALQAKFALLLGND